MDIANIRVGKPDVAISQPSHVRGVRQGNRPRRHREIQKRGIQAYARSARRATGVNPDGHEPIDRRMPRLTPP